MARPPTPLRPEDEGVPNRCTARSRQQNRRCRQSAPLGMRVCHYHGGAAPNARNAARARLAALVDPALGVMTKSLKSRAQPIALAAAKDILDRNGLKAVEKVQVQVLTDEDINNLPDAELAALVAVGERLAARALPEGEGDDDAP